MRCAQKATIILNSEFIIFNYMRTIHTKTIEDTVYGLFLKSGSAPCDEAVCAVKSAFDTERVPHAKEILGQIVVNNEIAVNEGIPACQDTGMAVLFIDIGSDVIISGGALDEAINNGVRRAYKDGYFRNSVLDPITRVNTGDNTPAVLHTRVTNGDKLKIWALPKGFGAENMSRIAMLPPSAGVDGIINFVVECVTAAGGSPCPPVVLGVGIGGTFESCALLSKRQLLRPLNSPSKDEKLAEIERECLSRINRSGIGPMGLGGDTTCLAVHAAKEPTHIASLPVAVNFCCHMLRHAYAEV